MKIMFRNDRMFRSFQRMVFLSNLDTFVTQLESLLSSALGNRKRQTTSDVEVKVIEESVIEQSNGNLQFSLIARTPNGGVVEASVLESTVQDNGADLAQDVSTYT